MATFGFIGEGITDQIIIENVLLGFANTNGLDEPEILPIQPRFDYDPGGWTLVFHYLRRGEHRSDLQNLDYLVIHVDTDVSQDVGFDVPWNDSSGISLPVETLAQNVITRLVELIGKETYEAHRDRFIFAIAVHSTECWLLPLVFQDYTAKKIAGCLDALNKELLMRKESRLSLADHSQKDAKAYRQLSRGYRRAKQFSACFPKNPSLALFVRQLERLRPLPDAASQA